MRTRSCFLELPGEIRELIYHHVFRPINNKHALGNGYNHYRYDLNLMLANQQIYYEARKVFRQDNVFVSIETPWPEAQQHVAVEGFVPLLITGDKAARFTHQHLAAVIDAPQYAVHVQQPRKFIILLDDLHTFTEMWYYSDLSHPGLNAHLRLTLMLHDPYPLPFEQKPVPKALQHRLLEPFGMVKGLQEVRIQGEHYESIEKAMRDLMAVPYTSAEECLEKATKLKDAGNAALQKAQYREALRLYEESFLAIHIVCAGRRRSIWGDAWFSKELRSGTFKGQHGQMVRLILRVRLVANIVLVYLKLEDFVEAHFWGMRSISMMREAVDDEEDEAMLDFAAANEMGKIYYRTGMASKALGNMTEARKLLNVAVAYLPNDPIVKKDLDGMTLRLG